MHWKYIVLASRMKFEKLEKMIGRKSEAGSTKFFHWAKTSHFGLQTSSPVRISLEQLKLLQ